MATNRQLIFDILATNKASGPIKKIGDDLAGQQKAWDQWKNAAGIASAAVLAGLTKFGIDSVQAYTDTQKSQAELASAFERFPALADTNVAALQELNSALAAKTGYDDDATAAAQATLATFGLTGAQIAELTPLMQDYATKTGTDMAGAAEQLGRAMIGQGRALRNVGIDFTDTGTVAGNYEQVLGGLQEKVGGLAEEMGTTAAGQTAILRDQFEEIQEVVGSKLIPALTEVTRVGVQVATWMSQHEGATIALLGVTGALAAAVVIATTAEKVHTAWTTLSTGAQTAWNTAKTIGNSTLVTWLGVKALELGAWIRSTAATVASTAGVVAHTVATNAVKFATAAWTAGQWLLNAALSANPIGLVVAAIAALVAGIVWAWNNVDWFREGILAAWEWIKSAWSTGTAAVGGWIQDVIAYVQNLWGNVQEAFGRVRDFIVQVFSYTPLGLIVGHWDQIIAFFKGLPSRIASAASGLWDGITSSFKSAINWVITKWNDFGITLGGGTILGIDVPKITLSTPNIPLLADGGVATRATLAVIGEAGRETVLPFDRAQDFADMVARNLNREAGATNGTGPAVTRLHPDDIDALAEAILAGASTVSVRATDQAQTSRTSALTRRPR